MCKTQFDDGKLMVNGSKNHMRFAFPIRLGSFYFLSRLLVRRLFEDENYPFVLLNNHGF